MDYCGSMWAHGKSKLAEKIQNRAICYVLGVHRNAPILAIQAEWDGFCQNTNLTCQVLDCGIDCVKAIILK